MKNILLLLLLIATAGLAANPTYYPLTTIAESCVIAGHSDSETALLRLNTVLAETDRSEFIAARLYHASGDLSNPSAEGRFADLGATTVPTVVYNASVSFEGLAPEISYSNILHSLLFMPAPVRMAIGSFNPSSGAVSATLTRLDPEMAASSYRLIWYLVEDNVGNATNVARQVIYQNISLPATDVPTTFNNSFTVSPAWITGHLWAIAALEKDEQNILQSASTLPQPTYNIRAAFPWWTDADAVVAAPNSLFNSNPFWIFNLGASDAMESQIIVESAPADWYFNYCDEENNCFPGSIPMPLVMAAGESKGFHLNLIMGSTGIAHVRFQITSANLGTFSIPFTVRTTDYVDAVDELLTPVSVRLQANYPNPFKDGTVFTVEADKALSSATIQIFDTRGRIVDETSIINLQQGTNQISWQAPQGLASGLYFFRLADDPATLRKMLYIK